MTSPIAAWPRPAFQPTGRRASVLLVAFADRDVLGTAPELQLRGSAPPSAPFGAVDLRLVTYDENPDWIHGWRSNGLRNMAAKQSIDLAALDAATCCYQLRIDADDPEDLAHLQLAWAVAARLAEAGSTVVLDVFAVNWYSGDTVAALAPDRPFRIHEEISLIAETEPTPRFGHAVHTRGMLKFGRPDLIAGVSRDQIEPTGRLLNQMGQWLAEGAVVEPGQKFRVDSQRKLAIRPYEPGENAPELELNNDGLLLVDI